LAGHFNSQSQIPYLQKENEVGGGLRKMRCCSSKAHIENALLGGRAQSQGICTCALLVPLWTRRQSHLLGEEVAGLEEMLGEEAVRVLGEQLTLGAMALWAPTSLVWAFSHWGVEAVKGRRRQVLLKPWLEFCRMSGAEEQGPSS
jgi:hypothetical protein